MNHQRPALILLASGFALCLAGSVLAQTGGGSSAGGSAGGGAPAGTAPPAGGASSGSSTARGSGANSPATGQTTPQALPGPQSRSPTPLPSTVPERQTGVPPVPSAGNAEPSSPIYRQDRQPNPNNAESNPADPLARTPQTDPAIGGSGRAGSGGAATGAGEADAEKNLGVTGTRSSNSIGEEPERVQREGGASGKSLEECMQNWDQDTHITQARWKEICQRLGH
jgi:hypothetical protein